MSQATETTTSVVAADAHSRIQTAGAGPSSHRVYGALREEIVRGLLGEGFRLVETEIAARYGVSRTPVREALARLQADRLTVADPVRGTIVRPIGLREIDETYVLREAFEALAARLASRHGTRGDFARLHALLDHMDHYRRRGDWQAWSDANWIFHDSIFQAAGNRRLRTANRELVDLVRRFFRVSADDEAMAERALREHRGMVEAMETGDADGAEVLARQHVKAARIATLEQLRAEREQPPYQGEGVR